MKKLVTAILAGTLMYSCTMQQANHYKVGESFKVRLEKNGIGGYRWHFSANDYVSVVGETDSAYYNKMSKLTEYTKIFDLQAEKIGDTTLTFVKKREFEPDSLIPEQNYKHIKISIKK